MAVDDEHVVAHAVVEGDLGDDVHAGVAELQGDHGDVRLGLLEEVTVAAHGDAASRVTEQVAASLEISRVARYSRTQGARRQGLELKEMCRVRSSIYMLAAGAFPSAGAEFPSWLLHWRPLPRWNPFVRRRRLFSASGIVGGWARTGPHVSCRRPAEFGQIRWWRQSADRTSWALVHSGLGSAFGPTLTMNEFTVSHVLGQHPPRKMFGPIQKVSGKMGRCI